MSEWSNTKLLELRSFVLVRVVRLSDQTPNRSSFQWSAYPVPYPVLNTQYSILNTRYPLPATPYPILDTQYRLSSSSHYRLSTS